nr:reverse transcriptase-like protein [Mycobacterium sp. E3298]
MYKAYVDGSYRDSAGVGFKLLRSKQLIYQSRFAVEAKTSMEAEYIGLREAFRTIRRLKIKNVKLYTDCMNAIEQINRPDKYSNDPFLSEIFSELKLNPTVQLLYTPSADNKAHNLSRQSMLGFEDMTENKIAIEYTKMLHSRRRLLLKCDCCKDVYPRVDFSRKKSKSSKSYICIHCANAQKALILK